jgi:transcription elongation factor SPT5
MSDDESEDKKSYKNESDYSEKYDEKENDNNYNAEDDDYKSDQDEDYDAEEDTKKKKKSKLIGNKRKRELKKRKPKKERTSQNYFLDIQAEEDEEEDSYGGGEITKEQQEKAIKMYDERHFKTKNRQMKITDDNEETIIKRLNEKANEPEEEDEDFEERRPTSEDPKLWLLKCKIGDEKECMANLYHKYFYFQSKEPKNRLKIFSITSFENLKGKIFIEAFGERDIVYAISGMSNVNPNSIQLIPINERMKVFDFDKYQKVDINNNQLVRIKQGNYEGDLAKVVYIEDPINKIYVSLVPRIYESTKNSSDFNVAQFSIKRTKIRPRQKLFNKKYGNNITTIHEVYGDCIKYGKFKFKDNLLIKPVRITSLETENIYPKEEEMQQLGCYKDENGVYVDKEGQKLIVSNSQSIQYKNGDKIKFTTGEYKGITGTVISQIGNKVKVNLDIKDLSGDYEFPVNMIELDYNFKPGEIVYVKKGAYKGRKGIVINIMDNNNVKIYDEINQTSFIVKNSDLILSNNMDFEEEESSMFKIGDLVNIKNSHIICYIIESSKFNLKVVTTRNEVKKISVREVDIINLKKKTTYLMDSKGYPLTPDNTVKVINGPNKGSKGTIKCIYNKYIFLHNNNYTRTNGIFCEINENVELLGSELLIEGSEKGKVNHRKIPNDIRELIGKTVHVIEGKWKGYNGILINADDKSIKLELSAKQKTISLPFSSIEKGDVNSAKDGDEPSIAPSLSMKTPAYFLNGHHS